jgi:hypothetical protein
VVFEIDFEKRTIKSNGRLWSKRCGWKDSQVLGVSQIEDFMQNGHVRIKINDEVGENFQTKNGSNKGTPIPYSL